jgi:hypothetical protein
MQKANKYIRVRLKIAIGILVASAFSITALYIISILPNLQKTGFNRNIIANILYDAKIKEIPNQSYYISGMSTNHFYLGNTLEPSQITILDYSLSNNKLLSLRTPENNNFRITSPRISIDSPYIYLADGEVPAFAYCSFTNLKLRSSIPKNAFFSSLTPISPSSSAIIIYDTAIHKKILAKETSEYPYIIYNKEIPEKQIDGFFCADGKVHYDAFLSQLVYVYHYRNQYILLDSNLNIQSKCNTIDTFSIARINAKPVGNGEEYTLATPPKFSNKLSCSSSGFLFVNSEVKADNERRSDYNKNAVIDVYSLSKERYLFSFYIAKYKRKKLKDFKISRGHLIALFDAFVVSYKINHDLL